MKQDYYTVGEVAKLYGISTDTLRFYDKAGLIKPKRFANGYRLYGLQDFYKLTIIRDLREMGLSLAQIGEHLQNRSVDKTLDMLDKEGAELRRQVDKLNQRIDSIERRALSIKMAKEAQVDKVLVKFCEKRRCVKLDTRVSRDEEVDFAIKKLHSSYEWELSKLYEYDVGATIAAKDISQGIYGVFDSVFIIIKDGREVRGDFVLEAGEYLSVTYRGAYSKGVDNLRLLMDFAEDNGYSMRGDFFELYYLDLHETLSSEEFITEIQVRVIKH